LEKKWRLVCVGNQVKTFGLFPTHISHFNHANILNFTDSNTGLKVRPQFDTVDQMNEYMMDMWNETVAPGDTIYHLGDVVYGDDSQEWMKKNWNKLNGSKRLIVGNHDDIKFLSPGGFFKKVYMWRMFPEHRLLLSHVPLHSSSLERGAPGQGINMLNVHGHIHQNSSPEGPYYNVSVENIAYTPVNIEDLAEKARMTLK
jgi:calcineurin-like phosphoesterase family protein